MTVGPVLELIMGSRSNVDLPLFHDPGLRALLLAPSIFDDLLYTDLTREPRLERPPSQLLDDLLDNTDLTVDPGVEKPAENAGLGGNWDRL